MAGIVVQLAISWLIIWLYERNDLRVLGFAPTKRRLIDLLFFFLVTALCCASGFLLKMYFSDLRWKVNPKLTFALVTEGVWWNIKSVLFEELIFRGVLFYILIKRLGIKKAIVISAVAFGIYHWFSFGVIGNPMQMLFTFLITGTMGLVYAFGYSRTMSLYVPCAIHLGWNVTQNLIFSQGPIGNGVFQQTGDQQFRTGSYLVFIFVYFFPMLSAMLLNFYLLKKKKQIDPFLYTKQLVPSPAIPGGDH